MFSSPYWSGYGNYSSPSRPEVQYHGLYNQGSTCYLNSVLQVLFMTEEFREAVESHCHGNAAPGNCLDCRLKSLFKELKRRKAKTNNITSCLGIDRVNVQRDAAEYFEKILNLTSSPVSQVFRLLLTHKTICSSCSTETDSDGSFWHLPLGLEDSDSEHSVVKGIEDYFKDSEFTGENQLYCDAKCDAKSDATTKWIVKNHPEVLTLLLKRFEFDYTSMQYIKINSTVAVPPTVHIPENQTYELYAVVDHFGSLRGGHYTATINVDGKWYEFNDTSVTETQVNKISSNTYFLFYKKTKMHAADNGTIGGIPTSPENCGQRIETDKEVCHDEEAAPEHSDEGGEERKNSVEFQNDGGSDDAREKKSEQTISATHKKHDGDEDRKNEVSRAESSRKTETAGSRRPTENKGGGREEKLIQVDIEPEARGPDTNGDRKDRRRGSNWLRILIKPRHFKRFKRRGSKVNDSHQEYLSLQIQNDKGSNRMRGCFPVFFCNWGTRIQVHSNVTQ